MYCIKIYNFYIPMLSPFLKIIQKNTQVPELSVLSDWYSYCRDYVVKLNVYNTNLHRSSWKTFYSFLG